jgi:hypothetical protein
MVLEATNVGTPPAIETDAGPTGAISHGNDDDGATTESVPEHKTLGEGSVEGDEGHSPEPGTEEQFTSDAKIHIETLMKRMNLPKEITYFQDKDDSLKFVIPINGKKYIASPEDVFKGFGLNQAGYQKLNEGKDLMNNVRDYFAEMKTNPDLIWDLAAKLGIDPNQLAQARLEAHVREAEMTPQEKAQRQSDYEKNQLKKENEGYKNKEKQREMTAMVNKERERYDTELSSAMEKHGFRKLSTTAKSYVLERAVGKLKTAMTAGRQLSCEDAVYLAKQDWQDFVQGFYGELDDDQIIKATPKNIIDAIRKADIRKVQGGGFSGETPSLTGNEIKNLRTPDGKAKKRERRSITDFFETLT